MLEELHVRDLALIEDVWLEFGHGMTVLSGETGAGKTALVGALKLLIGERADSTLVRAGAQEILVEGRLRIDDKEVLAKRRVSADGRSRCTLDGEMATVGVMAEVLGSQFDLHGQHEHQALLVPARHVGYLDRHVGASASEALAAYREAHAQYREALERVQQLEAKLEEFEQKADYLRFVVDEISAVASQPGEDEELELRMPTLRHGEKLALASSAAFSALRGDGGAADVIASAMSALERVGGLDPALDGLAERLGDASAVVEDIGLELREYGEAIEHDPAALDRAEARLATISGLKKKYGPALEDVFRTKEEAEEALASLDDGGRGLADARENVERAKTALQAAAETLSGMRSGAVDAFVADLQSAAVDLAMAEARFGVEVCELEFESWTSDGPHRVEFMYAPAEDQPFRPLSKIASGGEVSRVMLAIKGVLGAADSVPVLVFDEIDAGVGGAAAVNVGRRLAELAESHQVLVVTHLAQVAAFAECHLVVEKDSANGSVTTSVRKVEGDERVSEIARMLSGGDTETGRAHAEELLASAAARLT